MFGWWGLEWMWMNWPLSVGLLSDFMGSWVQIELNLGYGLILSLNKFARIFCRHSWSVKKSFDMRYRTQSHHTLQQTIFSYINHEREKKSIHIEKINEY